MAIKAFASLDVVVENLTTHCYSHLSCLKKVATLKSAMGAPAYRWSALDLLTCEPQYSLGVGGIRSSNV